jgi:membrane protein YqaA with SNARE-associated domain
MLGIGFVIFLQTNKMEILNFVGTLFGGWVGTIIGYYFGQRPAERERRRVEELTEYLKKRSDEMWARLEKMGGKEK